MKCKYCGKEIVFKKVDDKYIAVDKYPYKYIIEYLEGAGYEYQHCYKPHHFTCDKEKG